MTFVKIRLLEKIRIYKKNQNTMLLVMIIWILLNCE